MTNLEITEKFKDFAINGSTQRVAIYAYLDTMRNHPTVDTIYHDLQNAYPMLSKTTIYNTLKLFNEKGIIQSVIIEDGEVRYDANITFHAHFKCKKCNKIYDVFFDDKITMPQCENKFLVEEIHLNYRGLCTDCQID